MRLASCLVASVLMAVVWHASPVNGENYLRPPRTDAVSGAGHSDNELPKYTSKVHIYKSRLIESSFSITAIISYNWFLISCRFFFLFRLFGCSRLCMGTGSLSSFGLL
jgi:hypothetical protein